MKTFSEIRLTEMVTESLDEGKMKELQDYIDQGKSAEWIAKKIGFPVKDVKDFLKGYQKEDIDEGVDKSSDVYKEYLLLKKKSIADLRKMVGQSQRGAVDLKSYDKQGAISDLLRNKFGGKKVDAAMGLSEAYKKGDKVTVKNAKKYNAFSDPVVSGVVIGVTKDGVQVKVGTGSMTVDVKDIVESALTFSTMREAQQSPGDYLKGYEKSPGKSVSDPVKFRKTKFAILKNKKPLVLKGKELTVVGQGNAEKAVDELQAKDSKNDYTAMRTESVDEALKGSYDNKYMGKDKKSLQKSRNSFLTQIDDLIKNKKKTSKDPEVVELQDLVKKVDFALKSA